MHPLEKRVCRLVTESGIVHPGETVVAGVSGGPDSMALLHLLQLAGEMHHFSVIAAHLDHGLRPDEAQHEKELVRDACDALHIPLYQRQVDTRAHAREHKRSIEDAARVLRLDFLRQTKKNVNAVAVALGHTGDDQAEEVLLRLVRGSGRKGLAGMLVWSSDLFRPLLHTRKNEILAYLTERAISYAVDSTNSDRRFLRNRVRLDLLPFLEQHFNPSIADGLRATARMLADEEALLSELTEAAWKSTIMEETAQHLVFQLQKVRATPPAIKRRLMERACWLMGSRPSSRQIESLLAILASAAQGTRIHLAQGLRAERSREALVFSHPLGKGPFRGDRCNDKNPPPSATD